MTWQCEVCGTLNQDDDDYCYWCMAPQKSQPQEGTRMMCSCDGEPGINPFCLVHGE